MANEKNMNPVFSIKNFRSFGEEGADFELAPITVLTGCNSAGKSSLVKAQLSLSEQSKVCPQRCSFKNFLSYVETSNGVLYNASSIPLELELTSESLNLGKVDRVFHQDQSMIDPNTENHGQLYDVKHEGDTFEMTYTVYSHYLKEDVRVRRVFTVPNERWGYSTDNAVCKSYTIERAKSGIPFFGQYMDDNGFTKDEKKLDEIQENFNQFIEMIESSVENTNERTNSDWMGFNGISPFTEFNVIPSSDAEQVETWTKLKPYCDAVLRDYAEDAFGIKNTIEKHGLSIEERTKLFPDVYEKMDDERDYFLNLVNAEVRYPFFLRAPVYISSESATIQRSYHTDGVDKMSKAVKIALKNPDVLRFCNEWLKNDKKFDIAQGVDIEGAKEGGYYLYIYKNGMKRLLADEGYGITQLVSLLFYIGGIIYGNDSKSPMYVYLEEPEVHLHPKYQSILAKLFVEAYQKYNIHFIIETHSEYLIRKLQVMVADKENKLASDDVSINYVEKGEDGAATNRKIEILENGRLSDPFGKGFYDEADNLAMELFRYKARKI